MMAPTLYERFREFDTANPHVRERIIELALDAKRAGVRKTGIARIFELLRWEYAIETRGDEFQLNNSYRAFYSRLVMQLVPELDGFFDTRTQRRNAFDAGQPPVSVDEHGQYRITA